MSKNLQPVKGTKDLLSGEFRLHQHIIDTARHVGELYGFEGFSTPVLEYTDVFKRTLGDTSDIVNKEMFSFVTKGDDNVTMRPEFTAGIARAFISNGLQQNLPLKLFSYGPLFRYERPQKGRQRQFHQINFEWIGYSDPMAVVQAIALANDILKKLSISEYSLEINSLGDSESRNMYRKVLVDYMDGFRDKLSEDSKLRLDKNPLRILDSKDEADKKIVANAPLTTDYLSDASKTNLYMVEEGLETLGISYKINPKIVRGLDYYNDIVFEFVSKSDEAGAQNTILAGGCYDNLISNMGGPQTPAAGFAAGIERLAILANVKLEKNQPVAIVPDGDYLSRELLPLANRLRQNNIPAEIFSGSNFNKLIKKANKHGAEIIVIWRNGKTEIRVSDDKHKKQAEIIEGILK